MPYRVPPRENHRNILMRSKPCLTSADVKKILAACEAEAAKNKWAVSISIVDDGGFLLGFTRIPCGGLCDFLLQGIGNGLRIMP